MKLKEAFLVATTQNFSKSSSIIKEIHDKLSALPYFNGNQGNTILEIPEDAPVEVPRIFLESNDRNYHLRIAIGSIAVHWHDEENGTPIDDEAMEDILSEAANAIDPAIKFSQVEYRRAYEHNCPNSLLVLEDRAFKKEFVKDVDTCEVAVTRKVDVGGRRKANLHTYYRASKSHKSLVVISRVTTEETTVPKLSLAEIRADLRDVREYVDDKAMARLVE